MPTSETKFQQIIQSANDAIIISCSRGKIIFQNNYARQLFGFPEEEMIGKSLEIIMPERYRKAHKQGVERMGGESRIIGKTIELTGLRKDGTEFPIELTLGIMKTDKETFYTGIIRDISERKKSEVLLKNMVNNMNTLLFNIKDGFFSADVLNNSLIFLSKSHEDIYGYSQKDFFDNPNLWFEVIHPDDKKMIQEKMLLLANGETTYDEHRIIRKDGKIVWVEGKVTPLLDENGKLIRLDGLVSDISKRKKAERLKDEKINDLNNFIYKTTHDLKSPLSSMSGLINVAQKEISTPKSKYYFDIMQQSIRRMEGMLNDLTSIIETTNKKINSDVIDFVQSIDEIKKEMQFINDFDKIHFSVEVEQKNGFRTDKKLLATILHNLINNSVKYKKNNAPFIQIIISEDSKGVKIEITDNGIGIPTDLQPKVFDMFFRATIFSKGTGLGLYIVKTMVEKLFGKIEVSSIEGKGTTFTVFLPDILKYISLHKIE